MPPESEQPLQPSSSTISSVAETPASEVAASPVPAEEQSFATETPADVSEQTSDPVVQDSADYLVWEASEYIHHEKGLIWYVSLLLVVIVLLIFAWVFKLWLSIAVFVAMGAAIAVYAHKPPRVLSYQLDTSGVTIDGKLYPYENFRSFGVLSDIEWHAMDLEPTQRFMPRLTVLFGDDDFDDIVAHLERHLPRSDREPDLVERLSRYLRF